MFRIKNTSRGLRVSVCGQMRVSEMWNKRKNIFVFQRNGSSVNLDVFFL